MIEHRLHREQLLPGSPEDVFPFFSDARNLARITPPELHFEITSAPEAMAEGVLIEYRLRLFGVPFGWQTVISTWNPPFAFVDEARRGPFRVCHHSHRFEKTEDGTRMTDEVRYALPLQPLGEIALPIVRRQLDRIFDFRYETIAKLFG